MSRQALVRRPLSRMARIRRNGLGTTVLDDLISGLTNAAKTEATNWLIQQYASLRSLPQRLASLSALRLKIAALPAVQSNGAIATSVAQQAGMILQLNAQYPAMISGVDSAYQVVRQTTDPTSGVSIPIESLASTVLSAIVTAQQFVNQVNTVDDTLKSVLDHMLETGAITPAEVTDLLNSTQQSSVGWGKILIGGLAIGAGVWAISAILSGPKRA